MSNHILESAHQAKLRELALDRLTSNHVPGMSRTSASKAMGVLHELASSPETAGDALALLHELQVHQVELDIQEEELRRSRAEMEAHLGRRAELHDFLPLGCIAIDRQMIVTDINLAGARLLGSPREEIAGKSMTGYVGPESRHVLMDLLKTDVSDGDVKAVALQFLTAGGKLKTVRTAVGADPTGRGVIIAVVDVS